MELVVFKESVILPEKPVETDIMIGVRGFTFKKNLVNKLAIGDKPIQFAQDKLNPKNWYWRVAPKGEAGVKAVVQGHGAAYIRAKITGIELLRSCGIAFDFERYNYSVQTTTEVGLCGWYALNTSDVKQYPK